MENIRKRIKYPLYLFVTILVLKLVYIVVESYFNFHVLTVTTTLAPTKEMIETLNENGHRISAIGITLLLLPFLYYVANRFAKAKMIYVVIFLSTLTYLSSFEALNTIVEKVVQSNKEKRHDAYYVNVFKYGILNNIFTYDSFVDSEKIKNETLDVNDKILLTNTFLLLHADKALINKLKKRSQEKMIDLYIDKHLKEDFTSKSQQYKQASEKIAMLWNTINKNKKIMKEELSKLSKEEMDKNYALLTNGLRENYKKYKKAVFEGEQRVQKETTVEKLQKIKKDIDKYFKYKIFQKTKDRYRASMLKNFGHPIDPSRWKNMYGKVTYKQITRLIRDEVMLGISKKLRNMPTNLDIKGFMYHPETRLVVMQKLREHDIFVPYDFDYSYEEFSNYFEIMSLKKHKSAYKMFYTKLEDELGINDISLAMSWKEFIESDYIKGEMQRKLRTTDENINNVVSALVTRDLANFRRMIYIPMIQDTVSKMTYKKSDFKQGGRASIYGDNAIKLLYVPPFALSISILALLLNVMTVISMLLLLVSDDKRIINSLKAVVLVIMLTLPAFNREYTVSNTLLNESTTQDKVYLSFLSWMSYYEKLNYLLHKDK